MKTCHLCRGLGYRKFFYDWGKATVKYTCDMCNGKRRVRCENLKKMKKF